MGGARAVRVERQVHQAALREPLAAADPEAAPAGLDPRPRLDRDLGLLRRARLQLQLPLVQRLQARPEDDGGLLGHRRAALAPTTTRTAPRSSSRSASARRDAACEREWWPHVDYFFNKCLHLYPGMSEAPGYRTEASLRAGVVAQVGNTSGNMGMNKSWKELVEQRYIVAGSPATVRQQLEELATLAARRTSAARPAHRLGARRARRTARPISAPPRSCRTSRPLFAEYEDSLVAEGAAARPSARKPGAVPRAGAAVRPVRSGRGSAA